MQRILSCALDVVDVHKELQPEVIRSTKAAAPATRLHCLGSEVASGACGTPYGVLLLSAVSAAAHTAAVMLSCYPGSVQCAAQPDAPMDSSYAGTSAMQPFSQAVTERQRRMQRAYDMIQRCKLSALSLVMLLLLLSPCRRVAQWLHAWRGLL
jgi:hypothetical protein